MKGIINKLTQIGLSCIIFCILYKLVQELLEEEGVRIALEQSNVDSLGPLPVEIQGKEDVTEIPLAIESEKTVTSGDSCPKVQCPENQSPGPSPISTIDSLCYRDPNLPEKRVGRPILLDQPSFHLVQNYLKSKPLNPKHKKDLVPQLVTAFSANHFHEHQQIIPTAFEHYPNQKILVYDIGLSNDQIDYIKENDDKYIYAKYDFEKYPRHAKQFQNMVFKVTIWIECLLKYKACQWFDTSIAFTKNSSVPIQKYAIEKDTDFIYYIHPAGHNIAWATHPEMFAFFPSQITKFNENPDKEGRRMSMAGAVIIYDTLECREGILKWAYMCALNPDCISPSSPLMPAKKWKGMMAVDNHYCNGTAPKQRPYNCHRYDQSMLSILVNNHYKYETNRFHIEKDEWIAMSRRVG